MSDVTNPKPYFNSISFSPHNSYAKYPDLNAVSVKDYLKRNIKQAGLIPDKYVKKTKQGQLNDEIAFTPPYSKGYLTRLANAYEFDTIVKSGVNTLVHYIMGRDFNLALYPVSKNITRTKEELTAAIDAVLSEQEQNDLLEFVSVVDNACDIKPFVRAALADKMVYGRSAILKQRAGSNVQLSLALRKMGLFEGVPIALKLLSPFYLTQNHYDVNTWEVTEIEYDDPNWIRDTTKSIDDQPALPINDLIYFTHNDYNIAPNTHGYGLSAIQSVLALSGANRAIDERVLPELNTAAYAGTGIFRFTGMSEEDMDAFANSMNPSTYKATNQMVEYIPVEIKYDMDAIINQRDSNTRRIATALRMPSILINHEEITNRATSDLVINVWQQGDLEFARDELRDQMWKYWYRELMELYFPEKEFLYLKAKVIMEFKNIEFANFFEKAIALGNLVQMGIMSIREARERLNMPPYPEADQELADMLKIDIEEQRREENMEIEEDRIKQDQKFNADQQQQKQKTIAGNIKTRGFNSGTVLSREKRKARAPVK